MGRQSRSSALRRPAFWFRVARPGGRGFNVQMQFLSAAPKWSTGILAGVLAGCFAGWAAESGPSSETVLRRAKLEEMDSTIALAISEERCPGGVLWVEHGAGSYHRAYGNRA